MAFDNALFDKLTNNTTVTENGMKTLKSSQNALVDLFFRAGAVRTIADSDEVMQDMLKAIQQDFEGACRLALWARDVRGGAGERKFYRVMLRLLAEAARTTEQREFVCGLVIKTPEVGRWDDLFYLYGTFYWALAVSQIADGLRDDSKAGLVAKWMPRKGPVAKDISVRMGFKTPKQWRKFIVDRSNTVEQKMCAKKFEYIRFDQVPSLAAGRYTNAFQRHVPGLYQEYLDSLKKGETKVNASAVYPYDVVKTLQRGSVELANEQWKALPDYMEGSKYTRILPIIDTSGSMMCQVSGSTRAIDVSVSLGMYVAERNQGPFKDYFVTFSERPELQHIRGETLRERFKSVTSVHWGFNTDLAASFERILSMAKKKKVDPDTMPEAVLIISDMEFDQATPGGSGKNIRALEMIAQKYEAEGYKMPKVIFWNVASRHHNFPAFSDEKGVAMISGFSPAIMKTVLQGNLEDLSPRRMMEQTLMVERYNPRVEVV